MKIVDEWTETNSHYVFSEGEMEIRFDIFMEGPVVHRLNMEVFGDDGTLIRGVECDGKGLFKDTCEDILSQYDINGLREAWAYMGL